MSKTSIHKENRYSSKNILKRIFVEEVKPNSRKFIVAIICMMLTAACIAGQAYVIQPALDEAMLAGTDPSGLNQIAALIIFITLIKALCQYRQGYIMLNMNVVITNSLCSKMFKHFIISDISTYGKKSSAGMISNIVNDTSSVMALISLFIAGAFLNLLTVAGLLGNMLYQNYILTLLAFVFFPLAFYPIYRVTRKIKRLVVKNRRLSEKYYSVMNDSLSSIKVIKSYNAEENELARFDRIISRIYRLNKKINKIAVFPSPFMESLVGFGMAFVLWYGGQKIASGDITVGQFISFFASLMIAYKPIKALTGFNTKFHQFISGAKRAYKIIDSEPRVIDSPNAKEVTKIKKNIEFKDLSFAYGSDAETKAIDNLNFKLDAGKKYAFVGRSGGGKSTIFNLLLRFYDPKEGQILIDGVSIDEMKIYSLRELISYVGQENHLFEGSVADNIRYGKFDATDEEVIAAAKKANAHEFIEKMPFSYGSKIDNNGNNLSGGQKQRISIARAIIKNSPILLLDEATSALDTESEKKVQDALEKLMKGKTTLVIAHRLSTVLDSDEIFVIDKGCVIESGSHQELVEDEDSFYSKLYQTQFD